MSAIEKQQQEGKSKSRGGVSNIVLEKGYRGSSVLIDGVEYKIVPAAPKRQMSRLYATLKGPDMEFNFMVMPSYIVPFTTKDAYKLFAVNKLWPEMERVCSEL